MLRTQFLENEGFATFDSEINKNVSYSKNLLVWDENLRFGTSYFLEYKHIPFCVLSTEGVPTPFWDTSRTYQKSESSYRLSGPGFFDFQIGKSELSVPGTNDWLEAFERR